MIQATTGIDEKKIEVQLVSCKQFTVQGSIPSALYEKFYGNLESFQEALFEEIRKILDEKVISDVVDIRYAFNNSGIMDLLEKRAKALRKVDMEKVNSIE